jgi:CobQ/CobB/MinD/ParA nucleotide binding domain
MQTVAFYSYKGGVGRSLTVANFAAYLAQLGIHSIVMDLDLEAPGQHFKFGTAIAPLPVETGVVDILWSLVENHTIDAELVKKSLIQIELGDATGSVHLLPAGSAPSLHYQQRLRQLDMRSLLGDTDLGGLGLLELREVLDELVTERIGEEPHFLFIDSRTGITDLGKFACAFIADHLVAMFLDQPEHLEGTRAFLRSAASGPRLGAPLSILPVVSRVASDRGGDLFNRDEAIAEFLSETTQIPTTTLSFYATEISVIRHEPKLVSGEFVTLRDSGNWAPGYKSDLIDLVGKLVGPLKLKSPPDQDLRRQLNLDTMKSLAASLYAAQDYNAAARRYKEVLWIETEELGPSHESTISTQRLVAASSYAAKDYSAAIIYERSALNNSIEVFGRADTRTFEARTALAAYLYADGQFLKATEQLRVTEASS